MNFPFKSLLFYVKQLRYNYLNPVKSVDEWHCKIRELQVIAVVPSLY